MMIPAPGYPIVTIVKGESAVPDDLSCPGCHHPLDAISASGRADDLFLCTRCFHSWYAFELHQQEQPSPGGENGEIAGEE